MINKSSTILAPARSQHSPEENGMRGAARIVYVLTEDRYFVLSRLSTARAARNAGFEVHVITRVDGYREAIEAEGFHLHAVSWRRGSVRPFDFMKTIYQIRRLYKSIQPAIVHHVALEAVVLGGLAARSLGIPQVNTLAGLGFVFTSRKMKARLLRPLFAWLLARLMAKPDSVLVVQNPHDLQEMNRLGIPSERMAIVSGAAFDLGAIQPLPEPPPPIAVAYVGRMLEDKGVRILVEAHEMLMQSGRPIRLLLAGLPDPANPTSIQRTELEAWSRKPHVEWLGHVDIAKVWGRAHIAVLPSRREGLPRSLLEAAAYGRPIVATNIPGSREIAQAGVNALLVPIDDARALAFAIATLVADADMRHRYGHAGRRLVERKFSNTSVGPAFVDLYLRLLD
jgi:glycosyltransferase involved in cell wall biosynthesis